MNTTWLLIAVRLRSGVFGCRNNLCRLRLDSQKGVGAHAEYPRQLGQHGDVGAGLVIFPFADSLRRDTKLIRQPVLGDAKPLAVRSDSFS